jgi:hypothetical protein
VTVKSPEALISPDAVISVADISPFADIFPPTVKSLWIAILLSNPKVNFSSPAGS